MNRNKALSRNKWGDWFYGWDSGLIRVFGWRISLGVTFHLFKS